MKTTIVICFISLLAFSSTLGQMDASFHLDGTVVHEYSGFLYLSYGDHIDSTEVVDNRFSFRGQVDYPIEARIHQKHGPFGGSLYLENSPMRLSVSMQGNITYLRKLEGNQTADLIAGLEAFFASHQSDPELPHKLYEKLDKIISAHPRNSCFGELLGDIAMDPILSYEQVYSLSQKLDTSVMDKEDLQALKVSLYKLKNIKLGNDFQHFALPDQSGALVSSADFGDAFLLVEFWASWCGPCRKTNPELVKLYAKYQSEGFEILGVSLDDNQKAWKAAIVADKLTWPQTFAEGQFTHAQLKPLGVQYVPSNYLLDKEGKILAINIEPKELERKLAELVSN